MSKLSIVVPVYNEKSTLAECVGRVLAVEIPLEREVILVDDGSTDGSGEEAGRLEQQYGRELVRAVRHERNRGKGAALRTGFAEAGGDYVIV